MQNHVLSPISWKGERNLIHDSNLINNLKIAIVLILTIYIKIIAMKNLHDKLLLDFGFKGLNVPWIF